MADPTFDIVADAQREFLHLTLTGDWNKETGARFAEEVDATLRAMVAAGTRHGHLRTMIDMRRKNILPQNVAAEIARLVRPDSPSRRIALIIGRPLHRMQARRIIDERYAIFDTDAAAMAWLSEE